MRWSSTLPHCSVEWFILKDLKHLCFHILLEVFILLGLAEEFIAQIVTKRGGKGGVKAPYAGGLRVNRRATNG